MRARARLQRTPAYRRVVSAVWTVLGSTMALAHLVLVVVLIVGGPVALRRPWFVRVHVPAAIATAGVFALGADCPLTIWQKYFIRRAGRAPYEGGFLEHYLVEPLTGSGVTPMVNLAIVTVWVLPTVVAYALLIRRRVV